VALLAGSAPRGTSTGALSARTIKIGTVVPRSTDSDRTRRSRTRSIQWLKRLKPALFRQDLIALFDLLKQHKIKPLIAPRFPLVEARHAHELLGTGGVTGKIVLVRNGSSLKSGAA
jgi:NADPH:quinone reductase-like Zn-dependent oxidoreductase